MNRRAGTSAAGDCRNAAEVKAGCRAEEAQCNWNNHADEDGAEPEARPKLGCKGALNTIFATSVPVIKETAIAMKMHIASTRMIRVLGYMQDRHGGVFTLCTEANRKETNGGAAGKAQKRRTGPGELPC